MKDYKKILEEMKNMTIDDLPPINITDEQKNRARKKMFKSIEDLKERNRELNINISETEVIEISEYLGEETEDCLNGVKYGRVLREIALKSVTDQVKSK